MEKIPDQVLLPVLRRKFVGVPISGEIVKQIRQESGLALAAFSAARGAVSECDPTCGDQIASQAFLNKG